MVGYIFYDTETTGLTAGFDQILQFAALVTDDDLNVVEEVDLRCRLQPHMLPSPGALVITGISPTDIAEAPLSHYEMVSAIRALIKRHSPTTLVGFNSLGYDEAMLRQAFYQTLNPVYLTNTGGNTRMDMLRVAHAVSQYAPDVLTVPTAAAGGPTFKLGLLAAANDLLHDHAHDALSDTRATLELARLIRARAPELWDAMRLMRSKQAAGDFVAEHDLFWFTDMAFGTPTILATLIGTNPDNPSQVAVFDLAHDPDPYLEFGLGALENLLKGSPRPIRVVRLNSQPILMPATIPPAKAADFDIEVARSRARLIADRPWFRGTTEAALAARFADRKAPHHVEQRIYEGFPSRADSNLMERFHAVPWSERCEIVARITDDRLRTLGQRLIYLECPEVLPAEVRARGDEWRRDRWMAVPPVPWVTLASAREELEGLKAEASGDADGLLDEIEAYLGQMSADVGAIPAPKQGRIIYKDDPDFDRLMAEGKVAVGGCEWMRLEEQVILKVMAEGGSITLVGIEIDAAWKFKVEMYDCMADENDEDDDDYVPADPPWGFSWEEALQQLDVYPWATMVPLKVHPTFRPQVAAAVRRRIGSNDRRATENWRSVLAEHA